MSTASIDVAEVAREPAEIDQRLAQRVDVARLAAAKAFQQAPARVACTIARAASRSSVAGAKLTSLNSSTMTPPMPNITTGPISTSRCTPSTTSVPPETCCATSMPSSGAGRELARAIERGGGLPHGVGVGEIEQHEPGVALVRQRGRHRLEHDRKADRLRGRHGVVGGLDEALRRQRDAVGAEQQLRIRPR